MYFCTANIICICLVGQIDFNVSETRLSVVIQEALLQCNLLVIFSPKLFDRRRKGMDYNSVATWPGAYLGGGIVQCYPPLLGR